MTNELEEFRLDVERLAKNNIDEIFFNKGATHASIVLENIIDNAKKSICIYSGSLNSDVFDENLKSVLRNKIEQNIINVRVIVDDFEDIHKSECFDYLFDKKIIIPAHKGLKILLNDLYDKNTSHFCVADRSAYRLETNTNDYKATCNFSDKSKVAAELNFIFNHFWRFHASNNK